jgi:hypothetical protein
MVSEVESVTRRGRSKAPPELARFIGIANELNNVELKEPAVLFGSVLLAAALKGQQTPDFSEPDFDPDSGSDPEVREWRRAYREEQSAAMASKASSQQKYIDLCGRIATAAPLAVQTFLGDPKDVFGFIRNYALLRPAREILSQIAGRGRGPSTDETIEEFRRAGNPVLFSASIDVVVNGEGQLEILPPNELLKAISGVHAGDIRACAVCRRIFWASRSTSNGCSTQHRDTLRQRKNRGKKTKYEHDRRINAGHRKRRIKAAAELKRWHDFPDIDKKRELPVLVVKLVALGFSEQEMSKLELTRKSDKSGVVYYDASRLLNESAYRRALDSCIFKDRKPA